MEPTVTGEHGCWCKEKAIQPQDARKIQAFVGDVWLCVCHWQSPIPLNLTFLDNLKCQHWQDGHQYQGVWFNVDFQAVDIFRDVWTIRGSWQIGSNEVFEQIGIARRVVREEDGSQSMLLEILGLVWGSWECGWGALSIQPFEIVVQIGRRLTLNALVPTFLNAS